MRIAGKEYTPEEVFADAKLMETMVAEAHVERYPNGCGSPGHRCSACTERIGDTPHKLRKIGARPGYRGRMVCPIPSCPYYMS